MSTIVLDRSDGCFEVTMSYQNRAKTIVVKLVPDRSKWFTVESVTDAQGKNITGDERYTYQVHAEAELRAWFRTQLRPLGAHKVVRGLSERVTIAFIHALQSLDEGQRAKLAPVGKTDIKVLMSLAEEIRSEMVKLKQQAKREVRRLPQNYLYDIKREVLVRWRTRTPCSSELRDFYSSVLGTAFAWKKNRVPVDIYLKAQKIQPGLELAFALQ